MGEIAQPTAVLSMTPEYNRRRLGQFRLHTLKPSTRMSNNNRNETRDLRRPRGCRLLLFGGSRETLRVTLESVRYSPLYCLSRRQ